MKNTFDKVLETLEPIKHELLQVAVYESYHPKCVIILEKDPPHLLDALQPLKDYARKRQLPFPLLINRQFVVSSLDSFPLEFLDIISNGYHNLFAKEDLLSGLTFTTSDLLLQMERELKSKWLLTRLSILEQSNRPREIATTLRMSILGILPVLKGFCYINNRPIPKEISSLITQVSDLTGIELSLINRWISVDKADTFIIKNYLELVSSLIIYMEKND